MPCANNLWLVMFIPQYKSDTGPYAEGGGGVGGGWGTP